MQKNESQATAIARLEERMKTNNEMTLELLNIIKGNNGSGLMTKVAILETHPENCPLKTTVKWHTWAIRAIYAAPVVYFITYFVKGVMG